MDRDKIIIITTIIIFVTLIGLVNYIDSFKDFKTPSPQELNQNQILSLIELGSIKIVPNIEYTDGDKYTEIVGQTPNGNCYIYQDFLGRYYCRWGQ